MVKFPQYHICTLENKLQIVAIPMDNKSGVISTNIFYKVGSKDEIMGKSGIAHMLEHLNFKSTKNLKAGEFDEIVKGFGGVNNASTEFDYTHYFIKSSNTNLDKSLELFAELMQNLNLKDEEFQPERDVVLEERLWRTDNSPLGYLYFRLFNHAFTYHPYHWTPIGFKEDIKNWTIQDIKNFHQTFYQPQNAIVVVSGDIDKDEVFKSAKKYFKDIKNTRDIPTRHEIEPAQDGAKQITIYKDSDVQMLAIAYKIPNFAHIDQVALSALTSLLSDGKSSILQKELVEKKQLATQVYGYCLDTSEPGVFMFLAVCNVQVEAKKVKKQMLKIINDIKKAKFSDEDVEKIKLTTKSDFIYSLESSSGISSLFGSHLVRGDLKPLLNYVQNIQNLTKKDIVEVANKYFQKKNSTTAILKKEKSDEK